MRLVPDMDPEDILKKYTDYVMSLCPKGIQLKIKVHSKGPASVVDTDNKYFRAANEACTKSSTRTRSTSAPAARFRSSPTSRTS